MRDRKRDKVSSGATDGSVNLFFRSFFFFGWNVGITRDGKFFQFCWRNSVGGVITQSRRSAQERKRERNKPRSSNCHLAVYWPPFGTFLSSKQMRKRPLVLEKYKMLVSSSPCNARSPRATFGCNNKHKMTSISKDFKRPTIIHFFSFRVNNRDIVQRMSLTKPSEEKIFFFLFSINPWRWVHTFFPGGANARLGTSRKRMNDSRTTRTIWPQNYSDSSFFLSF